MFWSHAGGIVTTMTDENIFRNFPIEQTPGMPMCLEKPLVG
jgi:hypothetical protein